MKPRSAFTLIELLVVISIIALLISVLLPALSRTREQARTVLCLARLRELSHGWHMYADENRDVLLPGRYAKEPGGTSNPANWYDGGERGRFRAWSTDELPPIRCQVFHQRLLAVAAVPGALSPAARSHSWRIFFDANDLRHFAARPASPFHGWLSPRLAGADLPAEVPRGRRNDFSRRGA